MTKKDILCLVFVFALLLVFGFNFVNAETQSCNPTIQLVSQDPNPAVPNDYVKVIFEISNLGNCKEGFAVRLNPEYPFSLDLNDSSVQEIETNPYASGYRSVWMIPYKIRVDSAAFDGDYSLKLQYHEGSDSNWEFYVEKGFNVTIEDARTKFDAVIQESSGSDVSIAIANIGKYTANSVVVRIPEQESFVASGTDGQMVGNLESGDYTIVGFTVTSKSVIPQRNMSKGNGGNPPSNNMPTQSAISNKLQFDIYYTDNIGERRVVNMELPLNIGNSSGMAMGSFNGRQRAPASSSSGWIKWIIIVAVLIVAFVVYKKYPEQTKKKLIDSYNWLKSRIKKKEKISSNNKVPDWVKNAKEKEKRK